MKPLRLPANWRTFTVHAKLNYLLNTKQASSYEHAGRLLERQKQINKDQRANISKELFSKVRLPYADPDITVLPETQLQLI
jgi:hypothetical protein